MCAFPKLLADRIDAAFALNRFENHRANTVIEFGFKIRDVVKRDKFHAGNQRLKWSAIFFRGRDAECAKRAAVKRVLQGQDARLGWRLRCPFVGWMSTEPRQLERSVNRLGAAIRKKHPIEAGPFRELSSKRSLKFIV